LLRGPCFDHRDLSAAWLRRMIHFLIASALALSLSATPARSTRPSPAITPFVGDVAFDEAVHLCECRVAYGTTSMAEVPSLLRKTFDADFERLLDENSDRLVHNITCLQPALDTNGYKKYNQDLLSLPLRRGRVCANGCCSGACSRTFWPHLATRNECEQFRFLSERLMPDAENNPHHNMYLMLCAAAGEVRTTLLFVRLLERMRRAIAHEYGIPLEQIYPRSAFLSRLYAPGCEEQTLHSDESSFPCFHYSVVLYLSTQGIEFEGGSIRFFTSPLQHLGGLGRSEGQDPLAVGVHPPLEEVAPAIGSALAFSSGWENPHQVQPLQAGCRHAIPAFFATKSEAPLPLEDDAARAEELWCTVLRPESEDDFRKVWGRWHEILVG